MATHSSILAWRMPMDRQRSLGGYRPWGHKESDTTEQLSLSPYLLSKTFFSSVQFSSVTQSCPTLCNPMNHST